MSNNKQIQKVTLLKVKDGYGLKVIFKETDSSGDPSRDDVEKRGLIHPDLKVAIDALKVHWGLLSGLIKVDDIAEIILPEHKLLEKIHVNGYSIGGDEEENTQGVIISGHYITWRAKAQSLNTPFERFEGSPEARYLYMDDLLAKIQVLEDEVQLYLTGEKRGAKPAKDKSEAKEEIDRNQGKLFDGDGKVTHMQIAEPVIDPNEKVSPEAKHASAGDQHKYANKDAMARVAEEDKPKKKTGGKKPVKQTAEHPDGQQEIEEGTDS
jgi:hypothetical protein